MRKVFGYNSFKIKKHRTKAKRAANESVRGERPISFFFIRDLTRKIIPEGSLRKMDEVLALGVAVVDIIHIQLNFLKLVGKKN